MRGVEGERNMIRADYGFVVLAFTFPADVAPNSRYAEEHAECGPVIGWIMREGVPVPISFWGECNNNDQLWAVKWGDHYYLGPNYVELVDDYEFHIEALKAWDTWQQKAAA